MKRFSIVIMIIGLIVGSVATAEAKKVERKRVERTVEGTYATQFLPFSWAVPDTCRRDLAVGCVTIETRRNEAFLTAKVTDAHGQPVLVSVLGPSGNGAYGTFCGETEEPIAFPPGVDVSLWIGYFWPDADAVATGLMSCPTMFGTTGTVSVTLSNLP